MNQPGPTRARAARLLALLPAGLLLASLVEAQHAETVLFGESDPDGLAVPDERRFVHPITAPYYNENSFVTSDVRAWFVHHSFSGASLIDGGDVRVLAAQVRVALTETFQFVAYKDGFADFDTGLVDDSGLMDLGAGVKWNFLQDWTTDTHAAVGLGYELGIGDDEVLQDDDEVRVWGSVDKGYDRLHLGANVNFTFATGSEDALGDSDRVSWHLHGDYWLNETFSPVVEVNGYQTLDEGDNTPLPFSGVDVANLGGGDGEDVVALGLGFEVRALDGFDLRVAHETPLTDEDDLFGHRWTVSAVWGF